MRSKGKEIGRGVHILFISLHKSGKKISNFFYLPKYSLSDAHFYIGTSRLLFEFNHLQYTLAAPEVFVASANPVSLPSGYKISIVRNTNIDQIETVLLDTVEHADSRHCMHCP